MKATRTGAVIPYRVSARLMDWYQGRRDGQAGIPDPDTSVGRVTTPHRDGLIRLALEVFNHERLRYERARGDAPERIAALTARLDQLRAHEADARQHVAEVSVPLSGEESTRRRIGDLRREEQVIVQRRRDDQRRSIAAARRTLDSIMAEIGYAEAEKAAAAEADQRELNAASIRVYRFHEYIHRRLNSYLRTLIRYHFDGEWARAHLAVDPFLPGWISLEAIPKPQPVPVHPPTPAGPEEEDADEEPGVIIPLAPVGEPTVFGSGQPAPYNIDAVGTAFKHFELTRLGSDKVRLRDFGWGHGPYRDGLAVRSGLLTAGDYFDFADHRYTILPGCAALELTRLAKAVLVVAALCAQTKKTPHGQRRPKQLLSQMTFVQNESSVLAVVGRSGAGKSSLLNVLIGDAAVTGGRAFFNKLNMLGRPAQISDRMGFVPQDTNLYDALTVRQLLEYSFHLRSLGPANRSDKRVAEVCKQLQLEEQLNQLVATLSGGQKRRVSIAMEMLSEPDLLILDEPTSGLDPGMDREIMRQLRDYADGGKTVIVTTHNMAHLRGTADKVLVVGEGGRPIFIGKPNAVCKELAMPSYAELMDQLGGERERQSNSWSAERAEAYQRTAEARAAKDRAEQLAAQLPPSRTRRGHHTRRRSARRFWRQLSTLTRRQFTLLLVRGRTTTGPSVRMVVTALLPYLAVAFGAALAAWISPASGLGPNLGRPGATAIGVLTTLAVLGGQALTYGDLVAEFPIIQREHRTGAGLPTIILAKWLVFAAAAIIQAACIVAAFTMIRPGVAYSNLLPPLLELWLDLAVLTIGSMSLGLLISAACRKLEHAVAIVTLTSIAQIALNGVTAPVPHLTPLRVIAALLPDRWGVSAAASSVNLNKFSPFGGPPDPLWGHTLSHWLIDLAMTALLGACCTLIAAFRLWRRLRPARPPRGRTAARSGGR